MSGNGDIQNYKLYYMEKGTDKEQVELTVHRESRVKACFLKLGNLRGGNRSHGTREGDKVYLFVPRFVLYLLPARITKHQIVSLGKWSLVLISVRGMETCSIAIGYVEWLLCHVAFLLPKLCTSVIFYPFQGR